MNFTGDQASLFDPVGWSGKMSPEPSAATKERTSPQSSPKRSGSKTQKPPMCLCLLRDGPTQDSSTMTWVAGALLGDYTMLNIGECPSVENESRLSAILEDSVPEKYYLSTKACQGILRRAERRGKKLPEELDQALLEQAATGPEGPKAAGLAALMCLTGAETLEELVPMPSGCEKDAPGGKGPLIQTEKSGTLATNNDQTIFCIAGNVVDRDAHQNGSGVKVDQSFTLNTVDRHAVCAGFKSQQGADAGGIGYEAEQMPTLSAFQKDAVLCLNDQGGSMMDVSDKAGTLRAQSHGHEPVVLDGRSPQQVYENHAQDSRVTGPLDVSPTVAQKFGTGGGNVPLVLGNGQTNQSVAPVAGSLNCMHDQQAVYVPDVAHALPAKPQMSYREDMDALVCDKVESVDCRNSNSNGDLSGTLQSKNNGGFSLNYINPVNAHGTVRRLTPLECERLQGFPDGWTDIGEWVDSKGKKHKDADSPRYKALGNSIALPFWRWMLRRISAEYPSGYVPTLGSLFDGIGGFPYIWEGINGPGTAKWASEIEEFPIAVTKRHFPDKEET